MGVSWRALPAARALHTTGWELSRDAPRCLTPRTSQSRDSTLQPQALPQQTEARVATVQLELAKEVGSLVFPPTTHPPSYGDHIPIPPYYTCLVWRLDCSSRRGDGTCYATCCACDAGRFDRRAPPRRTRCAGAGEPGGRCSCGGGRGSGHRRVRPHAREVLPLLNSFLVLPLFQPSRAQFEEDTLAGYLDCG